MSDDASDDDKQFEASPQKLEEARKKGEFARSVDLNTAASYAGLILGGISLGSASLLNAGTNLSILLGQADSITENIFSGSAHPFLGGLLTSLAGQLAVWFAAPAAVVLLLLIAQRGIVFAPTKLAFKSNRVSPLAQAKQKFGREGFFEFGKSFAKLMIYSTVLFIYLLVQLPEIMITMALTPGLVAAKLLTMSLGLMSIVFVIAVTLGLIDFVWQRAEHLRKNRMSRKELTDEAKKSEGDPAMKQQRRQKGIAIAMNQMLGDVPTADVIVVNPTHFAVALKWDRASGGAPVCVAKGVDAVAARIREVAQEHAVPIHSDPPTARALYATIDIGDPVPPDHYRAVAAAIRFAERIRNLAKARG